jgi:uncharacterized protein (TIGR00730 family)
MRRVCVFCSSSVGIRPAYAEAARLLGRLFVEHGLNLVFGGGHIGLMGILADATLQAGGEVIGVIPRALVQRELAHVGLTTLHVVETMHERKALMADLSDAFAAMPGGYGTADELFEILTWAQLGLHAKPIGLLNVEGYFDPLLDWVDRAVREGFMRASHRRLLVDAKAPTELVELLLCYRPPPQAAKWIEAEDR